MSSPSTTGRRTDRSGTAVEDVVVLTGGDPIDLRRVATLPSDAMVIAADSGLHLASGLGLVVDEVVGDLDSVDESTLEEAERAGASIDRHPPAKDRTDLEIALDRAMELEPARITMVGGHGGRLDHLLGNLVVLASPTYADTRIIALIGEATVTVVHDEAVLIGRPGELVSLIPVLGPVRGVTTRGLRFRLVDEDLVPGSSRGVSNEFAQPYGGVRLHAGTLLAVQPGELSDLETEEP